MVHGQSETSILYHIVQMNQASALNLEKYLLHKIPETIWIPPTVASAVYKSEIPDDETDPTKKRQCAVSKFILNLGKWKIQLKKKNVVFYV